MCYHCATWEILLQNGPEGRAVYAMANKLLNSDLFIPAHLHGTEAFYFSVLGIIFHCYPVLCVKVHFCSSYRGLFFPPEVFESRRLVLLCTFRFGNRCVLET